MVSSVSSPPSVVAPSPAFASWSAFRFGSLSALGLRASSRSFSGWVVVAAFASRPSAARFARRWSAALAVPVFVRSAPSGRLLVSVPVSPSPSFLWSLGPSVPVGAPGAPVFSALLPASRRGRRRLCCSLRAVAGFAFSVV